MQLTSTEINALIDFLGYGNLDAPYWFLGMEEGTGGATRAEIEQRVHIHAQQFTPVVDLYESHLLYNYDVTAQRRFTQVWVWMAYLVRALNGAADWDDLNKAKDYIRFKLARKDGETFLTELLPLPAPGIGVWLYESLYKTRDQYVKDMVPKRQSLLRNLIAEHKPKHIFAYGSIYRDYYKAVISDATWRTLNTSKLIEVGTMGETTVVITPFFGMGGLSKVDAKIMLAALLTE